MDDLIVMRKEGVTLEVHPSCVTDHQRLGWQVVAVATAQTPAPPVTAAKPKRAKAQP